MTKGDIVMADCDPNRIEELCYTIVSEIRRKQFSLVSLQSKANFLKEFLDGLDMKMMKMDLPYEPD